MLKRLVPVAALVGGLVVLSASPAAAAECTAVTLVSCTSTGPSSQPSEQPQASQPAPPAPSPQPSPPKSTTPGTIGDDPAAAARILHLVNKERAGAGLATLEPRAAIVSIAARHSRSMAGRRDIWHNDAYFTSATRSSLQAKALGENVAMNGSIDDAHRRLMASPGHRANILNGSFDAVGIAVAHDEQGTLYVTQNFVDSAATPTAAAPRATAPARPAPARAVAPARSAVKARAAAPAPTAVKAAAPVVQAATPAHHVPPAELDMSGGATGPLDEAPGGAGPMVAAAAGLGALSLLALLYAMTRMLARP